MCQMGDTRVPYTIDKVKPRAFSPYVAQYIETEERDCTICTRQSPLKPRTLGCGHTFCKACVEALLIQDIEQLPLGRDTADVYCPTCTRGSSVKWIIDGPSGLAEDEQFYSLMTIRYDVYRKKAVQKYRQLIRSHFKHWREINEQLDREDWYDLNENTTCSIDEESRPNTQPKSAADDVRGFNHVTGASIECIVVQPKQQPGCMDDQLKETDEKQGRVNLSPEPVQNGKDRGTARERGNFIDERYSKTNEINEISSCSKQMHRNSDKGVAGSRDTKYDQRENDVSRGKSHIIPMSPLTSSGMTPDKNSARAKSDKKRAATLMYGIDQFTDVDDALSRKNDNKLGAWCAHISLVAFILVVSIVIIITTLIRRF